MSFFDLVMLPPTRFHLSLNFLSSCSKALVISWYVCLWAISLSFELSIFAFVLFFNLRSASAADWGGECGPPAASVGLSTTAVGTDCSAGGFGGGCVPTRSLSSVPMLLPSVFRLAPPVSMSGCDMCGESRFFSPVQGGSSVCHSPNFRCHRPHLVDPVLALRPHPQKSQTQTVRSMDVARPKRSHTHLRNQTVPHTLAFALNPNSFVCIDWLFNIHQSADLGEFFVASNIPITYRKEF